MHVCTQPNIELQHRSTDVHSQLSLFALRPLGRRCADLGFYYDDTFDAGFVVSVFHMILGRQVSSQGTKPDLSSVMQHHTEQQNRSAIPNGTNRGKQFHRIMKNTANLEAAVLQQ